MFKDFRVKDVFRIENPKGKLTTKMLIEGSDIPYVAAKKTENGIAKWCSRDNIPAEQIMDGNCIVFVQQGDGSAGYTTYQPNDFYAISCVCCGYIDGILDEKVGMYLMAVLNKNKAFYNHSYGWNGDRLKETVLALPVVENPDPNHEYTVDDIDWQYMRDRIQELERDRIQELDAYLKAAGLDNYELTMDEEMALKGFFDGSVLLKKFKIGELFASETGDTDIKKSDINGAGIQVVSSGAGNRGVIGKSDITAKVIDFPSITVDMFGNVFYRDEPYKMVTHARVFSLVPLRFTLDRQLGEYFEAQIKKACVGYDFNRMCSFPKICNKEIEVPVNADGSINFAYIYIYTSGGEGNNQGRCPIQREVDEYLQKCRVRFEKFSLADFFEVSTTKSVDKSKVAFSDNGEYDFIGRTSVGYGIQGKLHRLSFAPNPKDSFSLVQVGETVALWRENEWYASQNLFILIPKTCEIEACKLYFQGAINREMSKYGKEYNSYPTLKSLSSTAIQLPINSDSGPDFDYMKRYIRAMAKLVIADVVRWKDEMIACAKAVVTAQAKL